MSRRWATQAQLNFTGAGRAKLKRLPATPEAAISAPVKRLLAVHPCVALAMRVNTASGYLIGYNTMMDIIAELGGKARFEKLFGKPRWMEFGTTGWSDYVGQMNNGRFFGLETKPSRYSPSAVTLEQRSFLAAVNQHGGLGFVGSDLARIEAILSGREELRDSGSGFLV